MKRPRHSDPDVIQIACTAILDDVMEWLGQNDPAARPDDVLADLIRCADQDAYTFAANLDNNCFWSPDYELTKQLAGYSTYAAQNAAKKSRVEKNDITILYSVDDIVVLRGENVKIVDFHANTAQIVDQPVKIDGKNYGETGDWIHSFEDAGASVTEDA
jgi:hypothetical protein